MVVKDVMRVAGMACSGGSRALRAVAHVDATAVPALLPHALMGRGLLVRTPVVPAPGTVASHANRKSLMCGAHNEAVQFRWPVTMRGHPARL